MLLKVTVHSFDSTTNSYQIDYITERVEFRNKKATGIVRKHSDFLFLRSELVSIFPSVFVPVLQSPKPFFFVSADVVEKKEVQDMQKFMDKLIDHPVLSNSKYLLYFLDSGSSFAPLKGRGGLFEETPLSPPISMATKKNTVGLKFFSQGFGKTSGKEQNSPWFNEKMAKVLEFSALLEKCLKYSDKLSKLERGLATCFTEISTKVSNLSNTELNVQVAIALRRLNVNYEKDGANHSMISDFFSMYLCDIFSFYMLTCESIEGSFSARLDVIDFNEEMVKSCARKREKNEKLKSAGLVKADKVDSALNELSEAVKNERDSREIIERMTKNIQENEWPFFEKTVIKDFSESLKQFVETQIILNERILKEWQSMVGDVRAIDVNSSLEEESHSPSSNKSPSYPLPGIEKIAAEIL
jgi:hypothetical protein